MLYEQTRSTISKCNPIFFVIDSFEPLVEANQTGWTRWNVDQAFAKRDQVGVLWEIRSWAINQSCIKNCNVSWQNCYANNLWFWIQI